MRIAERLTRGVRRVADGVARRYFRLTLHHPIATLAALVVVVAALGAFASRVELDASADSLVLENDAALDYYREIRARYGSDDYLVVTYRPAGALFDAATLARLKSLRDELASMKRIASVTSLLDVPLLEGRSFADLQGGAPTLLAPATDLEQARGELMRSPLYRNVLVSADGELAGLYATFERDETFHRLLAERDTLRERRQQQGLDAAEARRLETVTHQFREHGARTNAQLRQDIAAVRAILDRYRDGAEIHLAGTPMIVVDMIRFIERDLRVFGSAVAGFIVVLLALAFHRPRWVAIPVVICGATAIGMLGAIGLVDKPLTVVSSNFLPVLLIVTLSLVVHLIVRHEELREREADADPRELAERTVRDKFAPCLYTALTTMVAFGSLTVSGIRPVIDLGWLMVSGIAFGFVLSFLAFPAALALLPAAPPVRRRFDFTARITGFLLWLVKGRIAATLTIATVLFALGVAGIARLSVENRFIDYFAESTEIHQGMLTIDRKLGGTTPLDVILDAPQGFLAEAPDDTGLAGGYWFNSFRFGTVRQVHDTLDAFPETGKVLSFATSIRMLEQLNRGNPLDPFTLTIVNRRLPEDVHAQLFTPYLAPDGNQLRFAVRIYESNPDLERGELLDTIRAELARRFEFAPEQIHLTGMTVLYNNLLESLYRSQVLTFGFVLVAIFAMFLALFRSFAVAAVALVPNVLVAALVLGLMGWLGIPLDIMTITIAAIAMGISVDDTIHYTHRFREEFAADGDAWAAARRSHRGIGRAVYYTSITITLGFAILVLSEFVPTITFGLLTGVAMLAALLADLTLLPALFALFRPFGRAA